MALTGIFVGNNPADLYQFERWFGDEADMVRLTSSKANWTEYQNSIGWVADTWRDVDRPQHWTIPMFVDGGNLNDGAAGKYNSQYVAAARKLIAESAPGTEMIIRVGEEFNGGWFGWAAKGKEAQFIQTYRNFVDAFRSVSDRFEFEWNVNVGDFGMNPENAYPGDGYVDMIGMDFYYNTQWYSTDPVKAWDYMLNQKYGLQWLENFADAHNKPTAYSEWSVNTNNAGPYIALADKWFESHDVFMHAYWNSNADFPGKLSDGAMPSAGAAYRAAFANDDEVAYSRPATPATSGAAVTWQGGTSGANTLSGDNRNNKIDGGGGADTMSGSSGDDSYTVDQSGDRVVENASSGVDTVYSYASTYTLPGNVENLVMQASYSQTGIGNSLANRISGNGSNETFNGAGGNDWLTGGGGNDVFVLGSGGGHDVVTDFSSGDRLDLRGRGLSYSAVQSDMHQEGSDVVISLDDGTSMTLFNTTVGSLGSGAFLL